MKQELAHPKVITFYITVLLKGSLCVCSDKQTYLDYWKNSDFLNHVIVSFLQRICRTDQMNLAPMVYQVCFQDSLKLQNLSFCVVVVQLSFLRIIQKIMEDPVVSSSSRFNELHSFCVIFCRNLFARINPSKEDNAEDEASMDQQEKEQTVSVAVQRKVFS